MANYANLLATIAANIYQNGNNEVTAPMVKTAVDAMVASLGAGYQFMGVATPTTDPGTPDQKVFYLASEPGTYTNFGGAVISRGLHIFKWDTAWSIDVYEEGAGTLVGLPSAPVPLVNSDSNRTGYIQYSDGNWHNGVGYNYTDILPVSEGVIVAGVAAAGSSVAVIACYDSGGNYIQAASLRGPGSADASPFMFRVPSGVSGIRLCGSNGSPRSFVFINGPSVLPSPSPFVSPAFGNNGYIGIGTGVPTGGGTYKCSDFIPVAQGGLVEVAGEAGASVAMIAFYDSAQTYLPEYSAAGGIDVTRAARLVPSGASFARVSASAASSPSARVYESLPDYATQGQVADVVKSSTLKAGLENVDYWRDAEMYPATKLPCVCFHFDDVPSQDPLVVELFRAKKVRCAFAFIADSSRLANKSAQYREYCAEGFQVVSHSDSANPLTTPSYTYDTALAAVMAAKYGLEDNGIRANGFVCPSSTITPAFMPILKLAHAYAFTMADVAGDGNARGADVGDLHRFSMQSATLAECESYIDNCIANDRLAVFYGHAADLVDGDTSVWSLNKIAALIDYCIAKRNAGELYLGNSDDCVKYFYDL